MKLRIPESSDWNTNTTNIKVNELRKLMIENNDYVDDPCVGIFWYDLNENELFGIRSNIAEDINFYYSDMLNQYVRTTKFLHYAVWQKECNRGKDDRFQTLNYTEYPRGRIFEIKDKGFEVYVGNWINDYPECKELILDEFQLPRNKTEFVIDIHWDLGHGWSDKEF
jgi:hypothetical protein